jgi:hypothetical protein
VIWLIPAVVISVVASAIGARFILSTNLSEALNPDLRSLRLEYEALQRDQRTQELWRLFAKSAIAEGISCNRVCDLAERRIVTREHLIKQIDTNRVLDLHIKESSVCETLYDIDVCGNEFGVLWH